MVEAHVLNGQKKRIMSNIVYVTLIRPPFQNEIQHVKSKNVGPSTFIAFELTFSVVFGGRKATTQYKLNIYISTWRFSDLQGMHVACVRICDRYREPACPT